MYNRVPDTPINLAEDISVRTSTTDGISWADGAHDGGLPVLDYRVSKRVTGETDYIVAVEGLITSSYTLDSLTLGVTYEVVVESRNDVGYSLQTDYLTILHALVPETPSAPSTFNNGQDVIVMWSAPANNGAAILSYRVEIRQIDGLTYS